MTLYTRPIDASALTEARVARFFEYVDQSGPCWTWTSTIDHKGYGRFNVGGRMPLAHRVSYLIHKGIPDGLLVRHECDVRPCVNPDHLILGTPKDNTWDMIRRGRNVPRPKGEDSPTAVLTNAQCEEIRRRYVRRAPGVLSNSVELSVEFGVTHHTIRAIARGLTRGAN